MRRPAPLAPGPGPGTLRRSTEDGRRVLWTRALATPPEVYGERVVYRDGVPYRRWDPMRSKLAAALTRGYEGALPRLGDYWLYLGAASGTTASHVADLVGPAGAVFAVEKSVRPFARLLKLAGRYPNLLPILADARAPRAYLPRLPPVDGLYVDVAQPDQVALTVENARWFLRSGAPLLLALKTASMGRDVPARAHLARALELLEPLGAVRSTVALEPFHRRHFLVEVVAAGRPRDGGRRAGATRAPPAARRR